MYVTPSAPAEGAGGLRRPRSLPRDCNEYDRQCNSPGPKIPCLVRPPHMLEPVSQMVGRDAPFDHFSLKSDGAARRPYRAWIYGMSSKAPAAGSSVATFSQGMRSSGGAIALKVLRCLRTH